MFVLACGRSEKSLSDHFYLFLSPGYSGTSKDHVLLKERGFTKDWIGSTNLLNYLEVHTNIPSLLRFVTLYYINRLQVIRRFLVLILEVI